MFTLVIGGAASGKSEYAEAHVETLPGRRLYIATMEPWDEGVPGADCPPPGSPGAQTVTTVECYRNLSQLTVPRIAMCCWSVWEIWWPMSDMGDQGGGVARLWQGYAFAAAVQARHSGDQ